MTLSAPILFLPLLLEHQNLFCAIVFDYRRLDLDVGNQWAAKLNVAVVFDEQYFTEFNLSAKFTGHFFEPNGLSGRHAVLLAARLDHRVHSETLLRKDKPRLYTREIQGRTPNSCCRCRDGL